MVVDIFVAFVCCLCFLVVDVAVVFGVDVSIVVLLVAFFCLSLLCASRVDRLLLLRVDMVVVIVGVDGAVVFFCVVVLGCLHCFFFCGRSVLLLFLVMLLVIVIVGGVVVVVDSVCFRCACVSCCLLCAIVLYDAAPYCVCWCC